MVGQVREITREAHPWYGLRLEIVEEDSVIAWTKPPDGSKGLVGYPPDAWERISEEAHALQEP